MKVRINRGDEKVKCNSSKCGYPEVHSEYLNGIELRWLPLRCEEASDLYQKRKRRLPLICILFNAALTCLDQNEKASMVRFGVVLWRIGFWYGGSR
jgi:hypothetical protein